MRKDSLKSWVYQLIKITCLLSVKYSEGINSHLSKNWLEKCELCLRSYFSFLWWQFNCKSVCRSACRQQKTWLILLYVGKILTLCSTAWIYPSFYMYNINIATRVVENVWISSAGEEYFLVFSPIFCKVEIFRLPVHFNEVLLQLQVKSPCIAEMWFIYDSGVWELQVRQ